MDTMKPDWKTVFLSNDVMESLGKLYDHLKEAGHPKYCLYPLRAGGGENGKFLVCDMEKPASDSGCTIVAEIRSLDGTWTSGYALHTLLNALHYAGMEVYDGVLEEEGQEKAGG